MSSSPVSGAWVLARLKWSAYLKYFKIHHIFFLPGTFKLNLPIPIKAYVFLERSNTDTLLHVEAPRQPSSQGLYSAVSRGACMTPRLRWQRTYCRKKSLSPEPLVLPCVHCHPYFQQGLGPGMQVEDIVNSLELAESSLGRGYRSNQIGPRTGSWSRFIHGIRYQNTQDRHGWDAPRVLS